MHRQTHKTTKNVLMCLNVGKRVRRRRRRDFCLPFWTNGVPLPFPQKPLRVQILAQNSPNQTKNVSICESTVLWHFNKLPVKFLWFCLRNCRISPRCPPESRLTVVCESDKTSCKRWHPKQWQSRKSERSDRGIILSGRIPTNGQDLFGAGFAQYTVCSSAW